MVLLSVTGLFRTLLIIIGVFVLLRFLGQMMQAKRNVDSERRDLRARKEADRQKSEAQRNFGKTTISKIGKSKFRDEDYTDFEELPDDPDVKSP